MVVLNKIYTRTGDAGLTALGTGERVPKHSLRIAAYGTVDETNAVIGMARLHLASRARRSTPCWAHPERPVRSRRRPHHAGAGKARQRRERRCASASTGQAAGGRRSTRSTPSWRRSRPSCCRAARPPPRRCTWRAPFAGGRSAGMVALANAAQRARRARRRSNTSIACRISCSWPAATSTIRGEGDVFGCRARTAEALGGAPSSAKDNALVVFIPLSDDNPLRSIRFQWVTSA